MAYGEKTKGKDSKLGGIVKEAYERFRLAMDYEADNHKRAEEAILFRDLEQWPEALKQSRENDPDGARPCLVVDKINQYINQVKNDQRQNRPQVKVGATDMEGSEEVAEVYDGIIRHIQECSRANIAYDTAHDNVLDGGFGYFRIVTEYINEDGFEQEPRIKRIRNRFAVLLDPARQEPDGSDAKWGFVFESLSTEEFKAQYPGKKVCSFEEFGGIAEGWVGDDYIIVAEYFKIECEYKTITVGGRSRKVEKKKVKWYKLNAAEVLDERDWPGKWIPIIEVIGNEIDYKGKRRVSGLVRGAMDSMRMFNYSASAFVELVALQPRAPWVAYEGQIENREHEWRAANRQNIAVLQAKPVLDVSNQVLPLPQRQPMPGIPAGWQQAMQNFEHDVQASMGMYGSNLGEQTSATSGRQELALQKRGDTATFHYADNLMYSIQHCGRVLIDLIRNLSDTERTYRSLNEDGSSEYVRINPEQKEAVTEIRGKDGKLLKYYNLAVGHYDVISKVGPAYTTRRQESSEWMMQMVTAKPELMQIVGDIMFRNSDAPGSDEIADRLKKMLPPQLQDQPDMDNLPEEVKGAISQAQAQIEQEKQMMAQAAQQLTELEKTARDESVKAQSAKSAVTLEMQKLQNAQDKLSAAEQIFQANMQAQDAQQTVKNLISEHESQVNAMLAGANGEDKNEAQSEAQAAVMASHQELLAGIQAVIAMMSAPKVRHSQAIGPSGQQYEITSTETIQ